MAFSQGIFKGCIEANKKKPLITAESSGLNKYTVYVITARN